MNKKIKFRWINEWKISKSKKIKTFTLFHCHGAYCNCGCHEFSFFFVLMSFGFFITINPTPVESNQPKITIEEPNHLEKPDEKGA